MGHAGAGSPGQDMNIHREPALVALDVYFLPLSPEQPREGIIIYLLRVYSGPFKIITPAHCICVLEVRCQGLSILPKVTQLTSTQPSALLPVLLLVWTRPGEGEDIFGAVFGNGADKNGKLQLPSR